MGTLLRSAAATRMLAATLAIALTGCGGFGGGGSAGSTSPPSQSKTPTTIALGSGDNQTAMKGTALPAPLVVVVTDAQGAAVPGVSVTFAVATGGGSLAATTATTDALGQASATLTVGASAGPNTVTASAMNAQSQPLSGSPLTFHATATDTPPPPPPPPVAVTYVADVAPILNAKCTSCHAPGMSSGAEPLDTYAAVTQGTSKQGFSPSAYVVAGQPANSLLMIKVMTPSGSQGSKMPLGSSLSATEIQTINAWITGGALFQSSGGGGATQIQKTSGDGQTATVGGLLANPFVVTVLDAQSHAVQGVSVSFAITSGNGSLSTTSATTDASGLAKTTLTVGLAAGTNTVTASSSGLTGSPITFTATGNPGPASKLALVSGDAQVGVAGKALANPLVVKVTDSAGNAVAGTNVTFAVATGGGSLSATTVATNGMGQSQTALTLGAAPATNTVTATASGLSGSPITFTETGNAGAAASLALVSGDKQSGTAGSKLTNALVVVVKDAGGNPVPGVSVAFAVTMGAGTLSAATATTGTNGDASVTFTLDKLAGTNKAQASVAGVTGSPVTFTETGVAGSATSLAKVSGDNQTQTVSTKLANPLVVVLKDTNGNAVPNTAIAFAVTTGGGTLSAVSTVTNASGQAQASYTLGAATGTDTVTVTKGALSVAFIETATAASAPTMSIVSGNSQSGLVGASLAAPLVIAIKDSAGNPVANKVVTFAVTAGGGTLSSVSAMTGTNGQASASLKLGTAAGANTVTCSAAGVNMSPQTFTETALAGAAAKLVKLSGDLQTGTAGSALSPIVVAVEDANGNPVKDVKVNFTTTAGTLSAASALSDTMGKAPVTLTLATTAGSATVTAAATGLTSVTFSETGKAGAAATVTISSGDAQSGTVSTALTNPLVVIVKDAHANVVMGATVTFAVSMGGGHLSTSSATTSAGGMASTVLTLGPTAGANKVTATVGTLPVATFNETATAVVVKRYYNTDIQPIIAASCYPCHQAGASGYIGADLSTYTALTTGTTHFAHTVTNYVVASSPSTSLVYLKVSGSTQGSQMPTAAPLSTANIQIISDWISQGAKQSNAGAPASLAKTAGDAQTGPAGTLLPTMLTVVVKDASSIPVSGVTVTFQVMSGGGSLSAASAMTNVSGMAAVSLTLGPTAGANTVKASSGTLTAVTFTETGTASSYSGAPLTGSTNPIDVEALKVLKAANVEPSALASDDEFLRRVYADIVGRLPIESERAGFLASTSSSKRASTIDSLLASAEFANHWANDIFANWACIHTSTNVNPALNSVTAFNAGVEAELMKDTPLSTIVKDMITGGGAATTIVDPKGNTLTWGQIWLSTFQTYGDTAQVDQLLLTFAGQTAECGRCHDHKLTVLGKDDPMWRQDDTYGLYAYVAVNAGSATKVDTSGKAFGSQVPCHFVADGYASTTSSTVVVGGKTVPMTVSNTPIDVRRAELAKLFIASNAFARGTSHRIFAELMDPLLDPNQFLAVNLAGVKQPGILSALEQQFTAGGTSLKSMIRLICNSKLYQLTTAGTTTAHDSILARRTVRRHHSEVIEQGIYSVTGNTFNPNAVVPIEQQFGYPLAHQQIGDRTDAVNIGQAFMLLNSPVMTNGLVARSATSQVPTLANQVTAHTITMDQAITTLYHYALGRDPSSTELTAIDAAIAGQTPLVALEDVAVALCASSEFVSR